MTALAVVSPALTLGFLALNTVPASASGGPDATTATITCENFTGSATFSPPLRATSTNEKIVISGEVFGCQQQGLSVYVPSGELSATVKVDLSSQGPDLCQNLTDFSEFPTRGKARISWSTPLSSGPTVFTIYPIGFPSDGSNDFAIGLYADQYLRPPATGSFQGPNSGSFDSFGADGLSFDKAEEKCSSSSGLGRANLKTPDYSPLLTLGGSNPE